jgi:hypothetical protein
MILISARWRGANYGKLLSRGSGEASCSLGSGDDPPDAFAEADAHRSVGLAPGA